MKIPYLVLLLSIPVLVVSCKKEHSSPSGSGNMPVTIPVIVTTAVSEITDSSAISGGSFSTNGDLTITNRGIQWDTGASFPNHWTVSAGSGIGTFTATVSRLMSSSIYYVRAYVGTDTSTYYGNSLFFTTSYTPGKWLVSTLAGTGIAGMSNGDVSIATFNNPQGIAVDLTGNIYVAEAKNASIRKITPAGAVSTLATLPFIANDVVTDSAGNVYVAMASAYVLKVSPAGGVSTLAGNGSSTHQDGTGSGASFIGPLTITIDRLGNLYVGDENNFRKITPGGVVTTLPNAFAGTSDLNCVAIAVDAQFNIFESNGHTVIKLDTSGHQTFIAGSGQAGFADGQGAQATFNFLNELRIDTAGNLYGSDGGNNRIRMITPNGLVTTIAGTGVAGSKDGNSAIATFNSPVGLALDNLGNIIVPDYNNNKIRKISPL